MTEQQTEKEIFKILEVSMVKRNVSIQEVWRFQNRLMDLINSLPDSDRKQKILKKIRDKQRFCYYINNTGILDFTGYGKNFW